MTHEGALFFRQEPMRGRSTDVGTRAELADRRTCKGLEQRVDDFDIIGEGALDPSPTWPDDTRAVTQAGD